MIVGTQIDLRNDTVVVEKLRKNKQKPTSTLAGEKLKGELNAVKYIECSALTQVLNSHPRIRVQKGRVHRRRQCLTLLEL